jgi:hypothetical protein
VDDFGTTAEEQREGEPLDLRVDREVPEDQAMFGDGEPVVWPAQPEEPSGEVREEPRPAGRLVAPDEGAHPREEDGAVASEAGPDFGGYSAEEAAMRVESEDPAEAERGVLGEDDPDGGSGRIRE